MATQAKFSIKQGQTASDVVKGAGTAISGSDAIEVNIDVTNMTQGDIDAMLQDIRTAILSQPFLK